MLNCTENTLPISIIWNESLIPNAFNEQEEELPNISNRTL